MKKTLAPLFTVLALTACGGDGADSTVDATFTPDTDNIEINVSNRVVFVNETEPFNLFVNGSANSIRVNNGHVTGRFVVNGSNNLIAWENAIHHFVIVEFYGNDNTVSFGAIGAASVEPDDVDHGAIGDGVGNQIVYN